LDKNLISRAWGRKMRTYNGLIIKEPFISMILNGKKTWEIRTRKTRIRGRILVVNKSYIRGSVNLVDCIGPLTKEEIMRNVMRHRATMDFINKYAIGKQIYAWVLQDPIKLEKPIKIKKPRGAQIWVKINANAIKEHIKKLKLER